jgi:HEAT repeat protein
MSRIFFVAVSGLLMCAGAAPVAQDSTMARTKAAELSRAWAAIGQGEYARAEQFAAAALRRDPADHAAISVSIAATIGGGKPIPALDGYEQWLQRTRHEDAFLLVPIAAGTLADIAAGTDVGLAVEAMSKLAGSDADAARTVLAKRTAEPAFDGVRAALGDKTAAARVVEGFSAESSREKLLALRATEGVDDIPAAAVAPLLTDTAPPVRVAAIELVARTQGAGAAETLRPLLADPDPFVQATAAVALGRLGDPSGIERLTSMLDSPIGDTAAMAAGVLKERGVDVSAAAARILADPNANPLTRLSAVPLLTDLARAHALLSDAVSDANPAIRARAAQLLAPVTADLPLLRKLLRDASPEVKLRAAVTLLGLSRPPAR